MLTVTTNSIEGRRIAEYYGIVTGEAIYGANIFRDFFAGIRDIVGGRAGAYEKVIKDGRDAALADMIAGAQERYAKANAIIGIDIDYESIGGKGSMLMVSITGTAVRLE